MTLGELKLEQMEMNLVRVTLIIFIFICVAPMAILIWYLNKRDIKNVSFKKRTC